MFTRAVKPWKINSTVPLVLHTVFTGVLCFSAGQTCKASETSNKPMFFKKKKKKDRPCTYNVLLRHVYATIFWSVKAINIKHYKRVSAALIIQRAMRVSHIVVCDLSGSPIFSHIMS